MGKSKKKEKGGAEKERRRKIKAAEASAAKCPKLDTFGFLAKQGTGKFKVILRAAPALF